MSRISHIVNELMQVITVAGNVFASKVANWFCFFSIGTGATLGVVGDSAQEVAEVASWGLPDYAALVSIAGGLAFFVKVCVDIYFRIKSKGKL